MEPSADASATDEPEMPAMIMLPTMEMLARPPRRRPTRALQKMISRWVVPPAFMRWPARMKKGMAIKGKESIPVNIRWATTMSLRSVWVRTMTIDVIPRAMLMGVLSATRTKKTDRKSSMDPLPPMPAWHRPSSSGLPAPE